MMFTHCIFSFCTIIAKYRIAYCRLLLFDSPSKKTVPNRLKIQGLSRCYLVNFFICKCFSPVLSGIVRHVEEIRQTLEKCSVLKVFHFGLRLCYYEFITFVLHQLQRIVLPMICHFLSKLITRS